MAQAATTITQRKCKCNTMNANLPLIAAFINFIVFCFADTLSPEMQIYWENHMVQPYFDNTSKREVTAIAGQTCQLHCRVKSLGDRAVSWIRKRDLHILTVGILTYTNDQRFQSLHTDGSDEWTLRITSPQARDSGVYECQVSTEPKISQSFRLNVVVSKANILGNSELFVKSGSDINLTCEALQSPQPPSFIYWYKGGRVINYSQRGGISVLTEQQTRTSRLVIARASPSDSGNYTCAPSNSDSTSVVVHVIKGEHPAAMQHGINGANVAHTSTYVIISPNGSISVSVGAARHVDAEDSGGDNFGMLPASATFSTSVDGYGGLIGIIIVIIAITIAIDCNASCTIDKLRGIRNQLQRIQ